MGYRRSVFVVSLTTPFLFYFCLKQKFKEIDGLLLFLISSVVLLSPYYRTSAYWGLEENYGLIFLAKYSPKCLENPQNFDPKFLKITKNCDQKF